MAIDFSKIRAFAFDVDGVFTDGGLLCTREGEFYRTFDAKDGFAVRMAGMHGYPVAIITGGSSVSIRNRFLASGVDPDDIYLASRIKTEEFAIFCRKHHLHEEEVLYMGDDIPDVDVMAGPCLGMCPCDAVQEVKEVADLIAPFPGGRGAVRYAVECVLKARGDWVFDSKQYKELF